MTEALPLEWFQELVASYGANPNAWPAERRASAVRCLVDTEAARAAWRAAAELDADLDALPPPDVSDRLLDRVLALTPAPAAPRSSLLTIATGYGLPAAAAAAIALIIGLAVPSPLREAPVRDTASGVAVDEPAVLAGTTDDRGADEAAAIDLSVPAFADGVAADSGEPDAGQPSEDNVALAELPLL